MSICIFPIVYKNEGKKIGIRPYPDPPTREQLKKCGTLKYSKTHATWYLPYERTVFELLKKQFADLQILTDNAPKRTETEEFHQTDIANSTLETTLIVEQEKVLQSSHKLRIVVGQENKGWLVSCDFSVGKKLKSAVHRAIWLKNERRAGSGGQFCCLENCFRYRDTTVDVRCG